MYCKNFFQVYFLGWCPLLALACSYIFFRLNSKFLKLGNQFASGVFLAISMHFLEDSVDVMDDYVEGSSVIPFLFVLIGYDLTLFGESILFKIKCKKDVFVRVEEGIKTEVSASDIISLILVNRAAIEVSILFILGLALHSAFEGITIGLAGERVEYSVGANFTPYVITVNAGEKLRVWCQLQNGYWESRQIQST